MYSTLPEANFFLEAIFRKVSGDECIKLRKKIEIEAKKDSEALLKKYLKRNNDPSLTEKEQKAVFEEGMLYHNLKLDSAKLLRIVLEYYRQEKKIRILILKRIWSE